MILGTALEMEFPPVGHVLVADDNPLSLEFFAAAISTGGHTVTTAGDGRAALACANSRRFDLLLIDHRMPGLDGPQTLRAIRSGDGPSRTTPALATSADSGLPPERLRAAGFDDVLFKPLGVRELWAAMSPYLDDPLAGIAVLDDASAGEKTGGDRSIVAALRTLLIDELDALPDELARLRMATDRTAMQDRLHRLDASAGFCGTPALSAAIAELRRDHEFASPCPDRSLHRFLRVCGQTREALSRAARGEAPEVSKDRERAGSRR